MAAMQNREKLAVSATPIFGSKDMPAPETPVRLPGRPQAGRNSAIAGTGGDPAGVGARLSALGRRWVPCFRIRKSHAQPMARPISDSGVKSDLRINGRGDRPPTKKSSSKESLGGIEELL
jgi:hypothetical protein